MQLAAEGKRTAAAIGAHCSDKQQWLAMYVDSCRRGSGVEEVYVCGWDDIGMNGQAATAGDSLAKMT